jgi:hypothetical protein
VASVALALIRRPDSRSRIRAARAALRFRSRGRGLHGAQVDLVLHDLQAGAHVAVDARGEQGENRLVVAQLRDIPQDHLVDLSGYRGGPTAHRRRDVGHQLGD